MSEKNTLVRKDGRMVKTFSSRINYVKESTIYEKLRKSGLTPDVVSSYDCVIEYKYVEGESLGKILSDLKKDPSKQAPYFAMFFEWYKRYHDIVKISIGEIEFEDFIVADDKLVCFDFEHCKPGNVEDDMARLISLICFKNDGYAAYNIEAAKLFAEMAKKELKLNSAKLKAGMEKEFPLIQKSLEIEPMVQADEYIKTAVCTSVLTLGLGDITAQVEKSMEEDNQIWTLILPYTAMKDQEKVVRNMLSMPKSGEAAFVIKQGEKILNAPVLLETDRAIVALKEALVKGNTNFLDTITGNLRYLELDI